MSGISLDTVVAVEKKDEVELCVAMPLVKESEESSELSKAELKDTTEEEVSIEKLLDLMSNG
jgi:hypothetical protein